MNNPQYSIDDNYMRDRFAKFITETATDFTNKVTPLYSSVITNLFPDTARLLLEFHQVTVQLDYTLCATETFNLRIFLTF
ncbi:hypothetical protein [Leuconostoc lactis]|uniref:hypothetical protein n=1 Tax=Leuconostoc lactis TaxID=1246 RepID=UPI003AABBFE6